MPHISLRIADRTFQRLEERRLAGGQTRSHLAKQLLEEGLRMEEHPGIVFRPGTVGRRPALANGPAVWTVASVFRELEDGGEAAIQETAELTGLTQDQVRTAVRYYVEYRDEIDEWIDRNNAEAERAKAAWHRAQSAAA